MSFGILLLSLLSAWPGAMRDADGVAHRDWADGRAAVFVFTTTDCPLSNGYVPELNRLAKEYGEKGVRFYGVQGDSTIGAEAVRKHSREFSVAFPVLMDPEQTLARMVGAKVTPEVAVLLDGNVVYVGRIDNRVEDFGKQRTVATVFDLRNALDAVVAGKPVSVPRTKAVGCAITGVNQ
jgi:thiol-disulfide isomerase/thioredoxin